ncbi:hypothetical protein HOLleu_03724 [Holothuria leucospilota]|uniref:Uncharacterized protein n=1 Tax=Holothuria leucospilota TaxID=206669 RepID=A0A9Q1CT75_HOLLE|nr:hypothetical protein HOLleu_03724 [Holothuria leucospilota]
MLHLLQDVSHQIASVSTPSKSLTVVTGSSPVFQGLLPMGTTPLSNGTELPRHVHGASSVISVSPGNQQESQNRLMQSVQHLHEPLSSSFDEHQPVGSHHSGSLTDLHPANQVRGNEHLPPAQQVIRSRAHQVMAAGVSQTFQNREHLVQPCTLMGLAESRNHMPLRSSMPTQPQVVNIEQNSQRCENTIQLQNAQQIVDNMQQQLSIPQNEMNNTRGRERTEPEVHIANESEPHTQHAPLPSIVVQQDLPDGELQTGLGVTECESIKKDILLACAQMEASVESFQKRQTIVLKGICEKLGSLPSSESHQLEERPETSLLSISKDNVSRNVTENDQHAITYLESLQEDDKELFLAFKNMSDDREELVRRLVEKIFTGEERMMSLMYCGDYVRDETIVAKTQPVEAVNSKSFHPAYGTASVGGGGVSSAAWAECLK